MKLCWEAESDVLYICGEFTSFLFERRQNNSWNLQCLIALLYLFSVLLNISIFYTLSLQQQFDKANAFQDVELKLKWYNYVFLA